MDKRRVVITGVGAVSCIGLDVNSMWDSLVNGRCGLDKIARFDVSAYRTQIAGEVKGFDPTRYMSEKEARRMDDFCLYAVAAADEAYLVGLCNKGTVNRAKKDLAALADPQVKTEGEAVEVRMGEVTCLIQAPLGESRCSCPSSGICRHRITAILWLKEQAGGPPEPEEKGPDFGARMRRWNFSRKTKFRTGKAFSISGRLRLCCRFFMTG